MTSLIDELSGKALGLPPGERVRLAEQLLATVHKLDAGVEDAWEAEIQRRLAEIDSGTATLIPADDVR